MRIVLKTLSLLFLIGTCNGQSVLKKLDGSISNKESKALKIIGENNGNQILLDDSSKDYIRVTVKSETLYVASLCACSEKGEVIVMHASAALGDQTYKRNESNLWSTQDRFKWEVREIEMTDEIISKRRQYLENHGWVANTMSMGNAGETEFIIDRKLLGKENVYIAIGLMTESDPKQMVGIPDKTAGDCAALSLVSGDPVSNYSFNPTSWIRIQ